MKKNSHFNSPTVHLKILQYLNQMNKKDKPMKIKKTLTSLLLATVSTFALNIGEIPKEVTLSGDNGGRK